MKIIRGDRDVEHFLGLFEKRGGGASPEVEKKVRAIIEDVRKHGDRALRKYTKRFDGHDSLTVPAQKISRLASKDKNILSALRLSAKRIRTFHEKQRERSWSFLEKGARLGQIIRPLERIGVYVPGGKAAYPSTVLMNVIPAQVAGVREIAVAVPTPGGVINPFVMAAIKMLGIREVYSIGGTQAIAALAYGTETIKKVDKIVGPGNIYVALAKKQVFGAVDIDMMAGPSEILVIADRSANPAFIASDMLSQAEHDELASAVLLTDSEGLAIAVSEELRAQLARLKRKAIAAKSLEKYGAIVVVRNMKEAVGIANRIAPEHLEIMTRNPRSLLKEIKNAGAVFLGPYSPEPLGDYSAGPNHTLPTGGTARFSSPLGVYDFIKRTSLIEFSKAGFMSLADTVLTLALCEGLEAHAEAVRIRKASS